MSITTKPAPGPLCSTLKSLSTRSGSVPLGCVGERVGSGVGLGVAVGVGVGDGEGEGEGEGEGVSAVLRIGACERSPAGCTPAACSQPVPVLGAPCAVLKSTSSH